jgi:hypothetical protein
MINILQAMALTRCVFQRILVPRYVGQFIIFFTRRQKKYKAKSSSATQRVLRLYSESFKRALLFFIYNIIPASSEFGVRVQGITIGATTANMTPQQARCLFTV